MNFTTWLDTLISEKDISTHEIFEVEGRSGANIMEYAHVIDSIKSAPVHEQQAIKNIMTTLDLHGGDIKDYLRHLAQAIAI